MFSVLKLVKKRGGLIREYFPWIIVFLVFIALLLYALSQKLGRLFGGP